MPKCPKCDKEIDYLQEFDKVWIEYHLSIGRDGHEDYYKTDSEESAEEVEFECPECHNIIFEDSQRAIKFLKGE